MTTPSGSSSASITDVSLPIVKYISQEISIKLSTNNYLLWKTQVTPVLRSHGVLGFVTGTMTKPSDSDAIAKWERLDQLVLGWLNSSLSDVVLSQVIDKETSRDVWITLEKVYGSYTRARIHNMKTELQSLSKGSKTITEFFQQANSLALALASAGKPVDPDDMILWVTRGVGPEYDSIVAAINARSDDPSLDEVYGLLLDHEIRLQHQAASPPPTVAFYTSQSRGRSSSSNNGRGRGYTRGRGAPYRGGRGAARGRSSTTQVTWYKCGLHNHKANHCFAFLEDETSHATQSFVAMQVADPSDPTWYPDTGATNHMTPDASVLKNTKPYSWTDHVMVGNGSGLEISQTGFENGTSATQRTS